MAHGHGSKLDRLQEAAIAALLTEENVSTAAEKAGVSYATLRNWLKEPDFLAEFRAARRQIVEAAVAKLQKTAWKAVKALEENLESDKPSAKNAAAKIILELALRGVELSDILERLEVLEQRKDEGNAPSSKL